MSNYMECLRLAQTMAYPGGPPTTAEILERAKAFAKFSEDGAIPSSPNGDGETATPEPIDSELSILRAVRLEASKILPLEPGVRMRPKMEDTHSRDWILGEAVRRWRMRSRAILENCAGENVTDKKLKKFLLQGGSGWPWNDGKTHLELIRIEIKQMAWMADDGWRVVRADEAEKVD